MIVRKGSPPKRDGVAGSKLQLQATLGKVFAKKAKDPVPQWGSWTGPSWASRAASPSAAP
ncbi:hypothetical protein DIPPA_05813 [Diplonema papillatum]|nr:hypothetical protein DIPPA_05813 [Diplonema papillatum]